MRLRQIVCGIAIITVLGVGAYAESPKKEDTNDTNKSELEFIIDFSQKVKTNNFGLELIPDEPLDRSVIPGFPYISTVKLLPLNFDLETAISKTPISQFLPYISVGETLPLLSLYIRQKESYPIRLRDPTDEEAKKELISMIKSGVVSDLTGEESRELFNMTLMASGALNDFHIIPNKGTYYKLNYSLEAFFFTRNVLCDPDDSGLFVSVAYNGTLEPTALIENPISQDTTFSDLATQLSESEQTNHFSFDIYIVNGSRYILVREKYYTVEQFVMLSAGIDNIKLFGCNPPGEPNANISLAFELPPLLFGAAPYFSIKIEVPFDRSLIQILSGEMGVKLANEDQKLLLSAGVTNNPNEEYNPFEFYVQFKADF